MANYAITNVARRVVYTGSAGVGPYAFTFPVLVNTDIQVYKNTTLLTLTTDYTVTISGSTGQGSVTLVLAAVLADRITIVGARSIERSTDFVTGGDFFANTLNTELDSETIFIQQIAETAERGLKAPVTDPTSIDMTLPFNTTRANKFLSFNSTGNPQAVDTIGTYRGNWSASVAYVLQDVVKDTSTNNIFIAITAHTSSGSQPITTNADSAKWSLVVDAASATTSATNAATSATNAAASASAASSSASGANTSATNAGISAAASAASASTSTAQAVLAAASAAAAAASADNFDDTYLGAFSSNPTLDNDGNVLTTGDLYFNTVANELRVYNGTAWQAAALTAASFLTVSNNLSDLANNGTARTNLGLGTIATVAAPSGTVVGTSDTQTLTNKTISGSSNTISNIGLSTQVTGTLPIANGGTGTTSTTFTNLTTNVTGTLPVANGGTGQSTYTDGQLLIGNTTGNTLTKTTITAGSGITVTNGSGAITIAASGGGGGFSNMTVFTSPGTFTTPATTTQIKVTVVGGGGRGGPWAGPVGSGAGGGGGGGATYVGPVAASSPFAVTVGAGGSASPSTGGTSSFATLASATGGSGNATAANAGGAGSAGTLRFAGTAGGIGGGAGGSGGSSFFGGGGTASTVGGNYGGGGGGGPGPGSALGNGAGGVVVVEF